MIFIAIAFFIGAGVNLYYMIDMHLTLSAADVRMTLWEYSLIKDRFIFHAVGLLWDFMWAAIVCKYFLG